MKSPPGTLEVFFFKVDMSNEGVMLPRSVNLEKKRLGFKNFLLSSGKTKNLNQIELKRSVKFEYLKSTLPNDR